MSALHQREIRDHLVVLVHAVAGPIQSRVPEVPCARSVDPSLAMYLEPHAHGVLHRHRRQLEVQAQEARFGWQLVRAEVADLAPDLGMLVLVLRLGECENVGQLLDALDPVRLRDRWWPDQPLVQWALPGGGAGHTGDLVHALIGEPTPVFADRRLLHMTYAALPRLSHSDLVYALTLGDGPSMPAPPEVLVKQVVERDAYRRWEGDNTQYTFCHHGAAVTRWGVGFNEEPPAWLAGLVANHYLDLATWVCAVAASRALLVQTAAGRQLDRQAWLAHLARWEWPRISEQDQGRHIVQTWLRAIERDRRDLDRLRELVGA